ncbi:ROK family protein [Asticcacaulis sp.]|uniref:ROK family protein n=1 Tax=Asticcacaulis sp. TaxID=1872648 RepID=UPI0031D9E604
MYIGIEIGGTKVIMAAGTCPADLTDLVRFPTEAPSLTFARIADQIDTYLSLYPGIRGIGVASFGPIQVNASHPEFGTILDTPKSLWRGFNIVQELKKRFPQISVAIDTDVNGAAVAEAIWGAGKSLDTFAYVTIGTGIGAGLYVNGKPVHGLLHPEAGHILISRDTDRDPFEGSCPFHKGCLEGLASGPTVLARTGIKGEDLPDSHPIWVIIGEYLAQLYYNMTLIAAPQRILIGGGVGLKPEVLDSSRHEFSRLLAGYLKELRDPGEINTFIQAAALKDRAGVLGAIGLTARETVERARVALELQ